MRNGLDDDMESQIDMAGAASSQTGGGDEETGDFKDHSVATALTEKSPDTDIPVIEIKKKKKKKKKKKHRASLDSTVTDGSITSRLSGVTNLSSNTRKDPPSSDASIDADILAKQQGRRQYNMSAASTGAGAVTVNTRDNGRRASSTRRSNASVASSLHTLEDDIRAKARSSSRSSSTATQPGAVAISANEPDPTAAKRGGGQRTLATVRRSMNELEKTTPAGSSQQGQQSQVQTQVQGRHSVSEQRRQILNHLEEDVVAKSMMRNDANQLRSSGINPTEADNVIQELDPDLIAKQHERESYIQDETSRGVQGAVRYARSIRKGMSKLGNMTRSIVPPTPSRPGAYHCVSQPLNNSRNNNAQSAGNQQRTHWTSPGADFDPDWDGESTPGFDVASASGTERSLSATGTRPASRPGASSVPVDLAWDTNAHNRNISATTATAASATEEEEDNPNGVVNAFVPDSIIEPYAVIPILSDAEKVSFEVKKNIRRGICIALAVTVILVSIVVPISLQAFIKVERVAVTDSPTLSASAYPSANPSIAPSSITFVEVMNHVSDITDPDLLMDQTSPQYKAATFMADHDPAGIRPVTDPRFLQRYALVTFYHATNGDKWRFCNPTNICRGPWKAFTSAFDECEWMGVVCNNEGMIEKIKIGEGETTWAGITGTLPDEIGYLTNVESFVLKNRNIEPAYINGIVGTIPSTMSRLVNLTLLGLDGNSFIDPIPDEWLRNANNIRFIQLHNNNFTGTLNDLFTDLPNLEDLSLQHNMFTGAIPGGFGKLSKLDRFNMTSNFLSESIPDDLYDAVNLINLRLSDNYLTGSISSKIGQLSKLESLDFSDNSFTGSLPSQLKEMSSLEVFLCANNTFTGQILNNLGMGIRRIELQNNSFTGTIPSILGDFTLKTLLLHHNNFSGIMPTGICDQVITENFMKPSLAKLTADCDLVNCTCCTCYPL